MKRQSFQVLTLKHQIEACLRLIAAKVKSAVLRLVDLEAQLADAQDEQLFSGSQIREAFQKVAGDFRYWKDEMVLLIPALIGSGLRPQDPWQHWVKFAPVQEMESLGWRDRVIALAIEVANLLEAS